MEYLQKDHQFFQRISKKKDPSLINLLEKLDDFILIFSSRKKILYANPSLLRQLDYTIDEIQEMNISDIFSEETYYKPWKCFSTLPLNKKNKLNIKLLSKSGDLIPVEMKVSRATFSGYNVFICIPRDITVRHTAEQALRESERKLTTLLGNLPGMAYRSKNEKKWTMEFVSDGCYALTGYTQSELVGKNSICWADLIHADDREPMWHEVQNAIDEKRAYRFIFRLTTADGKEKWVWEQGIGVFSDNGKLKALEGFITDFTRQKKIELQLNKENKILRSTMKNPIGFGNIIGQSKAMRDVFEHILQAANSSANVIIYGESGTGKELVANAIHGMSERSDEKLIPVNCGAIPADLFESEFFGYQKGAFSGAYKNKLGYLDLADGGTLFLDEIGEIDVNFQIKLLRALDGNGYTPVGGEKIKNPNIRIIAATNKNLNEMMEQGMIREDFFYRINVLRITLPPLRERGQDVSLLIDHFLEEYNDGGDTKVIPQRIIDLMLAYHWPGNIRELQNVIKRYVASQELDKYDQVLFTKEPFNPPFETDHEATHKIDYQEAIDAFEKKLILDTLEKHRWHRGIVASELGINYRTLLRKIKKHGISAS